MPYPSLHAVFVSTMNPFALRCVRWGATFAFHMRAFVALRLMLVARMPSFANGHLAKIARHQALNDVAKGRLNPLGSPSLRDASGWQGKMASDPTA